jgi:hypothetical protein
MSIKTQITAFSCAAVTALALTFATHLPDAQAAAEQAAPLINQKIVAPLDPSAQHDSLHLYKPRQVPRKGSLLIATPVARAMVA